MPASRREKIAAMLRDEPHDPFLRYSLAMELDREGDHEQSLQYLAGLMEDSPPYIAAFFMAAQQLARLGRTAEAQDVLGRGIPTAQAAGDAHAAGEMREFLASLSG